MLVKEIARRAKRREGFSLVELMVVVAIIAILAAIAVPQYKKYQLKAKTSEARMNIGAIKTTEESYAAENDNYLTAAWSPSSIPGSAPDVFNATDGFKTIGFEPQGKVYYCYAVSDGNDTITDSKKVETSTKADIVVVAVADLDNSESDHNPDSVVQINNTTSVSPNNNAAVSLFYSNEEESAIHDANPGRF
jgi:type IV pilus assembly protein PilA